MYNNHNEPCLTNGGFIKIISLTKKKNVSNNRCERALQKLLYLILWKRLIISFYFVIKFRIILCIFIAEISGIRQNCYSVILVHIFCFGVCSYFLYLLIRMLKEENPKWNDRKKININYWLFYLMVIKCYIGMNNFWWTKRFEWWSDMWSLFSHCIMYKFVHFLLFYNAITIQSNRNNTRKNRPTKKNYYLLLKRVGKACFCVSAAFHAIDLVFTQYIIDKRSGIITWNKLWRKS